MSDLLVKLYELPASAQALENLRAECIEIRRAIGPEKHAVVDWAEKTFSRSWASECDVALSSQPVTCFISVKDGRLIGFACYDATLKGFFGPIGVDESVKKKGLGKALLLRTLEAMRDAGYGYATRLLGYWIRERKIMSLEEGVRKLTFMVASIFGLYDRRLIRPGMAAD